MIALRFAAVLLALLLVVMPALAQDTISIGDTVEGELTENALMANYTFTGEAGQTVVITLRSSDFDAFLRLLDPDGEEIETDDDSAGSLNSRIGPFELPANGDYTIIASSLGGNSTGAFTLSLDTVTQRTIEYGQTINGELTRDELSTIYTFEGTAGDTITIRLNSDDFDSYLRLALSDNINMDLVTNDDGGSNLNSLIGPYELPQTGSYSITASSLGGDDTGAYALSLQQVEVTELTIGETVDAEITASDDAYFAFEGQAGQAISIAVDSGDTIDTTLTLMGPQGWQVAYDDDSGGSIDPLINYAILDTAGRYIVIVRPYSSGITGSFSITLNESAVLSLDDGPQTITLNEKQTLTLVQFSGEAGETVRVNFELVSGTTVPSNIEIMQNGENLSYVSASNLSGLSFDLPLTNTGTVSMQLESWSFESSTFIVTLSRVGAPE